MLGIGQILLIQQLRQTDLGSYSVHMRQLACSIADTGELSYTWLKLAAARASSSASIIHICLGMFQGHSLCVSNATWAVLAGITFCNKLFSNVNSCCITPHDARAVQADQRHC
jgi:hypothetical protein